MKKIALFLHNRFEEIEAVVSIDILRRAGYEVNLVSVEHNLQVVGSHGIKIEADLKLNGISLIDYDAILIPGGPGIDVLIDNDKFLSILSEFSKTKKLMAAICAAPQILGKLGLIDNKNITHFPGANKFLSLAKIDLNQGSVVDQNIITGQSAGSAIQFALDIVEYFDGLELRQKISEALVFKK